MKLLLSAIFLLSLSSYSFAMHHEVAAETETTKTSDSAHHHKGAKDHAEGKHKDKKEKCDKKACKRKHKKKKKMHKRAGKKMKAACEGKAVDNGCSVTFKKMDKTIAGTCQEKIHPKSNEKMLICMSDDMPHKMHSHSKEGCTKESCKRKKK